MDELLCNSLSWKCFVIVPWLRTTGGCALGDSVYFIGDSVYLIGFNSLLEPELGCCWWWPLQAGALFPCELAALDGSVMAKTCPAGEHKANVTPKTTRGGI